MNRYGQLQKIYDEAILISIASSDDLSIVKQAGLWDELGLDGIGTSIKNMVKSVVSPEGDSPTGYLGTLKELLISGALFKIHPVLGIAYAVAEAIGIDVKGIAVGIFNSLKNAVLGGGTLTESEFDSITKSAAYNADLTKIAQKVDVPFFGRRSGGLMARVFGNLFSRGFGTKASFLAKGIVIWVFKTALLGLGLLTATGAATGAVKRLFGGGKEEPEETTTLEETLEEPSQTHPEHAGSAFVAPSSREPARTLPTPPKSKLRPSGAGERKFKNDANNMWIVPLVNGNVEDTLLAWVEEIYPQLSGYDYIIVSSPEFQRLIRMLERTVEGNSLLMPAGFTSRKQAVDLFAHKVAEGLEL